jgi:hypothetical protein
MYKYNGKGFIAGIPARDLTDEEVKQYGEKRVLASGLYEKVKERKAKKENDVPVFEQAEE